MVDGLEIKDNKHQLMKMRSLSIGSSEGDPSLESKLSHKSSTNGSFKSKSSSHNFGRRKKKDKQNIKKRFVGLRFRSRWNPRPRSSQPSRSASYCCDKSHQSPAATCHSAGSPGSNRRSSRPRPLSSASRLIDLSSMQDFDRLYPVEDAHELLMRQRAEEIHAGVEVDASSLSRNLRQSFDRFDQFDATHSLLSRQRSSEVFTGFDIGTNFLVRNFRPQLEASMNGPGEARMCLCSFSSESHLNSPRDSPTEDYSSIPDSVRPSPNSRMGSMVHTQIDFIHCLMPGLMNIMACPFYWGEMDRYEAERLLDSKPEGTFLLRDSAQEDFLFSVSFRRYNRSLHARVEQWNHRFSFDAHDPAVFSAPTVVDLMEHYKDSSLCMFFEPMLTRPLPRKSVFSLQHICRSVICDKLVYDQIRLLPLPNSLKQFLQVYHYKQKVRTRRFDGPELSYAETNLVM